MIEISKHKIVLLFFFTLLTGHTTSYAQNISEEDKLTQKIIEFYNYTGNDDVYYLNDLFKIKLKREISENSNTYTDRYVYINKVYSIKLAHISVAVKRLSDNNNIYFDIAALSAQCWNFRSFANAMTEPPSETNSVMNDPDYAIYQRQLSQQHVVWVSPVSGNKLSLDYINDPMKYGGRDCIRAITIAREH
ncbi:hypothetical protein HK11_09205 [Acetobacter sp. DmW_043]|uniref:hypothetical protein n=1 Tax=Acetobacter sp. DmW_043 TaxID=1670658 RepID=UPI000A37BD58|nr:hypothetical protein [Acetobacter sp. DmW_043]OUI87876.1 hypothetical protein HK11_09205 [Acetobacter sp. DmW_043]